VQGSHIYSRIGIITFYAGQVTTIKRKLKEHGVAHDSSNDDSTRHSAVKVMSVDGFQGSEADIIFISFVRCNSSSNVGFVDDFQRLNVSLTRAKHALVMVGCTKTLENSGSEDLQQLIVDARARRSIIEDSHVLEHITRDE
jgi:senataxin